MQPNIKAKGSANVADYIIELAKASGVQIKEDRQLVIVLPALVYPGRFPMNYKSVSEIPAFIYSLSKKTIVTGKTP